MDRVVHKSWIDKHSYGERFSVTMCGLEYKWLLVGGKTVRSTYKSVELVERNWKKVTCERCLREKD